jgi:hypothetical protein
MHEGKILTEGSYDDLRRNRDPFVARFLQDGRWPGSGATAVFR